MLWYVYINIKFELSIGDWGYKNNIIVHIGKSILYWFRWLCKIRYWIIFFNIIAIFTYTYKSTNVYNLPICDCQTYLLFTEIHNKQIIYIKNNFLNNSQNIYIYWF